MDEIKGLVGNSVVHNLSQYIFLYIPCKFSTSLFGTNTKDWINHIRLSSDTVMKERVNKYGYWSYGVF